MWKLLQLIGYARYVTRQFVVLDVVISILNMILSHNLDFADVLVALPGQKVDLLKEFLFVKLQISHFARVAVSL